MLLVITIVTQKICKLMSIGKNQIKLAKQNKYNMLTKDEWII